MTILSPSMACSLKVRSGQNLRLSSLRMRPAYWGDDRGLSSLLTHDRLHADTHSEHRVNTYLFDASLSLSSCAYTSRHTLQRTTHDPTLHHQKTNSLQRLTERPTQCPAPAPCISRRRRSRACPRVSRTCPSSTSTVLRSHRRPPPPSPPHRPSFLPRHLRSRPGGDRRSRPAVSVWHRRRSSGPTPSVKRRTR